MGWRKGYVGFRSWTSTVSIMRSVFEVHAQYSKQHVRLQVTRLGSSRLLKNPAADSAERI